MDCELGEKSYYTCNTSHSLEIVENQMKLWLYLTNQITVLMGIYIIIMKVYFISSKDYR